MKWESVTSTLGYSVYALWNNGRKLATLVFNFSSNAARIEYADEKRVFLVRKEGFMKNKTVLRNEYGIRVGYAGIENNESFIELDNQRFFYSIDDHEGPAVTIYKESKDQPLAICGLDVRSSDLLARVGAKRFLPEKALYSLLLGLCLCLFKKLEKEPSLSLSLTSPFTS